MKHRYKINQLRKRYKLGTLISLSFIKAILMRKLLFLLFILCLHSVVCNSQNVNVTLAAHLSYGGERLSNIHGWKDPVDGKEYALVGAENGLSIVDVSVPSNPVEIVQIPGPSSSWREIKTVGDYAYITTEDGSIGLQIVQLTNLPNTNLAVATWKPKIGSDSLETIHALHADNGKIYLYGSNVGNGGCIIADVSTTPMAPVYLGKYDPRYIHDGFVRNDTLYAGHIYDGETSVVKLTNPASPVLLATFETPTKFTHNAWLSQNSKVCFTTDENTDSYLAAFDISDLSNISETDRIQSNPESNSIVHNTHILQKNSVDYAVTSWYVDGFTITDASRPRNLVQVGNYDTYTGSLTGFNGCWGVYPFLPSGTIVTSDIFGGLDVFSPTYVRACYLEGLVKNCAGGTPLNGVTITLQVANPNSDSHIDITNFQGEYAVGSAAPGTYVVVASKTGYISSTHTVVLTAGVVKLDTFTLCQSQIFSYSGNVFNNLSLAGIPSANVSIYDANSRWDTITDANGNFTIPNMFAGTYTVSAGKWGYFTSCSSGQSITAASGALAMGLNKGIYDDFLWDFGWTTSGGAAEGMWERGEPLGTSSSGNPINPDSDNTTDCGDQAYVTGNQGLTATDDDVDGGTTILTSPVFDLTGYVQPYIYFSRWKRLSSTSTDTIFVTLSNGTTTAKLESLTFTSLGQASWSNRNYKISNYLTPTSTMTFKMQVSDDGSDNTNEGALDKFYILDSAASIGINEVANKVNVIVYPNPFTEKTTIHMSDPTEGDYSLRLFDVYGRAVRTVSMINSTNDFVLDRQDLTSGMYFYQIHDGNNTVGTGKICVE